MHFFPVGGNGVDLVDEDDGWTVLLSFLKGFSQVSLSLTGHLGHDFRAVDQEEEGSGLVCHCSGDEGLARSGRTVEEHSSWRFNTQSFEELRVAEGQFDHFSDGGHLFAAASDIVVTNVVEFLLVLTVDGFALSVKNGVGRNDAVLLGFGGNNFELYGFEVASDDEEVSLFDRSVGVFEVGYEVGFGEVASDAFDGVADGEDVYFGEVGHLSGRFDLHDVSEADSEVFADGFVHADFALFQLVVDECDHECFFSLLALDEDCVAFENFEFCHLGLAELH